MVTIKPWKDRLLALSVPLDRFAQPLRRISHLKSVRLKKTGYYALLAGSTECTQCPAGMECDGSNFPTACGDDSYSTAGMSQCIECPAGYKCEDQTSKTACSTAGEYSLAGELFCNTCPAGHECPLFNIEPRACDFGYYSAPGATACTECPAGS